MSQYQAIKAATNAYIKTNGRQEITGAILNAVMIATIDSLGKFYQFVGNAVPNTDPGSIDQNVAYISGTPGTYTKLGGFEIEEGEVAVLKFDGEWKKEVLIVIPTKVSELINDAGYITNAVSDLVNYYTKGETDTALSNFFTKPEVNAILSGYYDKDEVDSIVSAITGQSYVVAWDGTAEPVVGDIPSGVSVTWGGNPYVGTLPASASTTNKIYLVSNGAGYDEYITTDNSGYAWVNIGTTSLDLSGYATKAELTQLEHETNELITDVGYQTKALLKVRSGSITGTAGNPPVHSETAGYHCSYWIPVQPGKKAVYVGCTAKTVVYIDSSGNFISNIGPTLVAPAGAVAASVQFQDSGNANGYDNAYAYFQQSNYEALTYRSMDFNCFYRYASYSQIVFNAQNALRAFVTLKLTGFDATKKHNVRYISRNTTGNKYRLIIVENDNGTFTDVFDVTVTGAEVVANACNRFLQTKNGKTVDALIDWNFIPDGTALNVGNGTPFCVKPECYDTAGDLEGRVTALEQNAVTDSDLTVEVVSNNIANPDDIEVGKYINNAGGFSTSADWALCKVAVQAGEDYVFGGFKLGRTGYYAFYNGATLVSSAQFSDPNGMTNPVSVTAPSGANLLYIDIKTDLSPSDPYAGLQVNEGEVFLDYDAYKTAITKINGTDLAGAGGGGGGQDLSTLIQDLPVSADGSDIATGYAYINSGTGAVIVKQ